MIKYILIAVVGASAMSSFAFAAEMPKDKKACMMVLEGLDPILDSKKIPKDTAKSMFGKLESVSVKCQTDKFAEAVSDIEGLKVTLSKLEDK